MIYNIRKEVGVIKYYVFMFALIFVAFCITRMNTAYHPKLLLKKYIVVKNSKLRILTISKINPTNIRISTPKWDRNKLLYLGLVFYVLWILAVVFTLIMWFVVPEIITETFSFNGEDGGYSIYTLNKIMPLKLWCAYCLFDFSFSALNIVKCNQNIKEKMVLNIIWITIVIFLFVISLIATGYIFI